MTTTLMDNLSTKMMIKTWLAFFSAAIVSGSASAFADDQLHSNQSSGLSQPRVSLVEPYKLTISNNAMWPHSLTPCISLIVQNTSKHTAGFYFSGASDCLVEVSYRPTNLSQNVWLKVASKIEPGLTKTVIKDYQKFSNVEVDLQPGATQKEQIWLSQYDLDLDGDYKISLRIQLPDPTLGDAETGVFGEALTKNCRLITVNSNVLVLRRTPTGFKVMPYGK